MFATRPLFSMSLRRCALGPHRQRLALRPQHALARPHTTAAPSSRLRAVFLNAERLDFDGDRRDLGAPLAAPSAFTTSVTSLHSHPQFAAWSLTCPFVRPRQQDVSTTHLWQT
jgi:hypothetical protein